MSGEADLGEAEQPPAEGRGAPAGEESAAPLRVEDLAVGYPTSEGPIVDCETLYLPAGEVTALVGPNGSGKSTLLKALAAKLAPDRGEVLLDGADVNEMGTTELARRLGLLAQEHDAPDSVTVEGLAYNGRYPHRGFFEAASDNLLALRDGELHDWGPPADVVTEDLLASVFGVDASVVAADDGPRVVPKRPLE